MRYQISCPNTGSTLGFMCPDSNLLQSQDFSDKMPIFLQESPDSLAILTYIINNDQHQEKVTSFGNFRCHAYREHPVILARRVGYKMRRALQDPALFFF